MEKLKKKESMEQLFYVVGGSLVFAAGVNLIIVPMNLYNGGFMGAAQIIRTVMVSILHISLPGGVDLSGIVYYILNVPLFYMGLRIMGKGFALKTLITVTIQSIFLIVVPIPGTPVIDNYLTACIIGGIIAGTGAGMILRGRSSGGGQDIIGVCFAKQYPNISVGKINILINICVYVVCLFLFNIETVIYSLIYSTVLAIALDKQHIQNINMSAMIFTKVPGIDQAILEETGRGVTEWEGVGAYTNEKSHILFVMISKYEREQIREIVHKRDPHAFMIFNEGCAVDGHFEKRL